MNLIVITLERLNEFLNECKKIFAPYSQVEENDINIEKYVLNIDYKNDLAFDTDFIIGESASSSTIGAD